MGTRSNIGIVKVTGDVETIYCHWDGYPEHNGKILLKHYSTADKVKELLKLGDISSLGKNVNPTGPHSYANPEDNVTVAYHRDRGEDLNKAREFTNVKDALKYCDNDYTYLFIENESRWKFREWGGEFQTLTLDNCKEN